MPVKLESVDRQSVSVVAYLAQYTCSFLLLLLLLFNDQQLTICVLSVDWLAKNILKCENTLLFWPVKVKKLYFAKTERQFRLNREQVPTVHDLHFKCFLIGYSYLETFNMNCVNVQRTK